MRNRRWDIGRLEQRFRASADHQVAVNLRISLFVLMPILVLILISNVFVVERAVLPIVETTIAGAILIMIVAYHALARGRVPEQHANALGFAVVCIVLVIPTVHMSFTEAMRQTLNFVLIIFAAGCILLSRRWLLAAACVTIGAWASVVWAVQPGRFWPHYAMSIGLASALSFALQTLHRFHLRNNERLREELASGLAALQESEARYRGLIESQHDLIVRVGTDTRFRYVNDALCQRFGIDRDSLLGMDITALVHPDDLPGLIAQGRSMTEPPHRVRLTHRANTPAGICWLEWEACAIRNADGSVTEVQGIGRDVTDRVTAELAAADREEYLRCVTEISRALLEADAPDQVLPEVIRRLRVVSGADRCYLYTIESAPDGERRAWPRTENCAPGIDPHSSNPAVPGVRLQAAGLGQWADILAGNGIIQVDQADLTGLPQALLATQRVERVLMLPLQIHGTWQGIIGFDACHADLCWSEQHVSLLKTAAYVIGAAIAREETERLVELQRIQMIEQSKRASLWMMGSGLAHEINNPLAIISGAAEGIAEAVTRDPAPVPILQDLADRISRHVRRIAHIVRGLRTLTRDASQDPFETQPLRRALDEALELCQSRFQNRGIQLEIHGAEDNDLLECRPTQIAQVFLNLLNNAFDAVIDASEKWVRVNVTGDAQSVTFDVTDSGFGIAPDAALRIFEPFHTTKAVGQGMGVGLSISKAIVENHGGSIVLDTTAPHTRFVVCLPRHQGAAIAPMAHSGR